MDEYGPRCRAYNRSNTDNARKMRQNPTSGEDMMREHILKHRPLGYKFTRQKLIGSFIVDFYCAKLALAIEVDGEIHKKRKEYDKQRSCFLVDNWVSVTRYWNNEILNTIDEVYKDLMNFMRELINQQSSFKSPC